MKHIKVLLDDQEMAVSEPSPAFLRYPYCTQCPRARGERRRRTEPAQVQYPGSDEYHNVYYCTSCTSVYWSSGSLRGEFAGFLGNNDDIRWVGIPFDEMEGLEHAQERLGNQAQRTSVPRPSVGQHLGRVRRRNNRNIVGRLDPEVGPEEAEMVLDERRESDVLSTPRTTSDTESELRRLEEYYRSRLQEQVQSAEAGDSEGEGTGEDSVRQAGEDSDSDSPGRRRTWGSWTPVESERDVGLAHQEYTWRDSATSTTFIPVVREASAEDYEPGCDCGVCRTVRANRRINAES